jgi:group I intron endonuclease
MASRNLGGSSMIIYTIYKATNSVNDKVYVGFDSNWPRRIREHKTSAFNPNKQSFNHHFHNALRHYGFDKFVWEPIYQSIDREHTLNEMERYFINFYDSYSNGYNSTLGGEGRNGPLSETARISITETNKSPIERAKRSQALKGIPKLHFRKPIHTPLGIFESVSLAIKAHDKHPKSNWLREQLIKYPDQYYLIKNGTDELHAQSVPSQPIAKGEEGMG